MVPDMIRSIVATQFCETAIAAKIGDVLEFFASVFSGECKIFLDLPLVVCR